MKTVTDLRLLAPCPVCGSKTAAKCLEISTARMRGKCGSGSLAKFRKSLNAREPHESRLLRSRAVEQFCVALALIATQLLADPKLKPTKRKARAA